jgi:tetratricopeptide (TPR) repeat protein
VATSVLVLGTSNSLLKLGWLAGFRAASADLKVTNRSVGGSPGIQFGCILDTDFSRYDLVILESVPNDERPDHPPHAKAANWRMLYEIASIIASKTVLILLSFTNKVYLAEDSEEYSVRRHIGRLCGAPFLDIRYLVNEHALDLLGQTAEVYEHPAHPARDFSRAVGFEFGRIIVEGGLDRFKRSGPSMNIVENNFIGLDASEYAPQAKVQLRKSSSISTNIAVMFSGDRIEINRREKLIGFYVDKVDTNGAIVFHFERPRGRREFHYKSELARFELGFVQVGSGAIVDSLHVTDRHGQEPGSGRISLGKMLFWKEPIDKSLPDAACVADNDDLTHQVDRRLRTRKMIWRDSIAAFRKGKELVVRLEKHDAMKEFLSALYQFPRHSEAVFDLAKSYYELGQHARAIDTMTRYTELEPDDTVGLRCLAGFLAQVGSLGDARSTLQRALQIRSDDPGILNEISKLGGTLTIT